MAGRQCHCDAKRGKFSVSCFFLFFSFLSFSGCLISNKCLLFAGSRAAPREIDLDNSILPAIDNDHVRVGTPPRTISLAEHHFPSAAEGPRMSSDANLHRDFDQSSVGSVGDKRKLSITKPLKYQQDLFNSR